MTPRFWKPIFKTEEVKKISSHISCTYIIHRSFLEKKRQPDPFHRSLPKKKCNHATGSTSQNMFFFTNSPHQFGQVESDIPSTVNNLLGCIFIVTIFIYLEPKWPLFWLEKALFWAGWPSKIEAIWVLVIYGTLEVQYSLCQMTNFLLGW